MVNKVEVREGHGKDTAALSDQSLMLPGQWEKQQRIKNASGFMVPVGLHWVERDVLNVSEVVRRLFPRLRVASCVCGHCLNRGHFPHVVVELGNDGQTYPVFGFEDFGPHVIERIRQIHVSQEPEKKSRENNKRIRESLKKKAQEKQQENLEVIQAALSSSKFHWKGPKGFKTDPYKGKVI